MEEKNLRHSRPNTTKPPKNRNKNKPVKQTPFTFFAGEIDFKGLGDFIWRVETGDGTQNRPKEDSRQKQIQ